MTELKSLQHISKVGGHWPLWRGEKNE